MFNSPGCNWGARGWLRSRGIRKAGGWRLARSRRCPRLSHTRPALGPASWQPGSRRGLRLRAATPAAQIRPLLPGSCSSLGTYTHRIEWWFGSWISKTKNSMLYWHLEKWDCGDFAIKIFLDLTFPLCFTEYDSGFIVIDICKVSFIPLPRVPLISGFAKKIIILFNQRYKRLRMVASSVVVSLSQPSFYKSIQIQLHAR